MELSISEDCKRLLLKIRDLVENTLEPLSLEVETNAEIPAIVIQKFRELGLFGLSIPKEYGGHGLTTLEEILVYEEITKTNACYRSKIGTSNSIGSLGILYDGTERQRERYLPRVASGEWPAAFALTEPNAGSDAANISTTAILDGNNWILNGNKLFITNADTAHIFTTLALTDEKKRSNGGITAFIVERGMPGFFVGEEDKKMGINGSQTHELIFKDCRVPMDNVIGGENMVGNGFKTAMRVLNKGRLAMGACALGAAQKLMDLSTSRVQQQLDAGKSKSSLQSAMFIIADMATQIFAARQMLYKTAILKDQNAHITCEASMVKLFCTEMVSRIADDAMEIFGEDAILTKFEIERFLRDVRLYRIYEGTSEIQRIIISREILKNRSINHISIKSS